MTTDAREIVDSFCEVLGERDTVRAYAKLQSLAAENERLERERNYWQDKFWGAGARVAELEALRKAIGDDPSVWVRGPSIECDDVLTPGTSIVVEQSLDEAVAAAEAAAKEHRDE